mgnify:FL=1
MGKDIQKEMRKQMFDQIEADLQKSSKSKERMFALHPDEEHVIVSHALFLMMSKPLAGKLPSLKGLFLLRKFEEEMLTAYLTESDEFPELLRYCNLLYDVFPYELAAAARNAAIATKVRKLQTIGMVAAGYGGDMEDDTVDDILDDMDFDRNNKVCSHVIELMMPQLNQLVEREKIY